MSLAKDSAEFQLATRVPVAMRLLPDVRRALIDTRDLDGVYAVSCEHRSET
jgi:hypothetical protein